MIRLPKAITEREEEILKHIVSGWDAKRIASVLDISVNTVRNHIANIYQKLQVQSKAQIMQMAHKNKWLLLVIVSLVSFTFANAQTSFGIKGGINITTITGDNSNLFSSSVAAHAGGFANFSLSKEFSLQPELVLSIEGAKFSVNGITGRMSGTYINMPFIAQYNAGSGFMLQTGPQLGLLMSANQKVTNQGSESIKDDLKSTNFSWAFGAGFLPKASKVGVSVRYIPRHQHIGHGCIYRRPQNYRTSDLAGRYFYLCWVT
jgi:DNA-binding CsgD family transcriptional regulator